MNMPLTWPDGTPRSPGNAFAAAYLPKVTGKTAYPARRALPTDKQRAGIGIDPALPGDGELAIKRVAK